MSIKTEETLAHLVRNVEDLSDIVTRQQSEIDRLTRQVDQIRAHLAEAMAEAGGGIVLGDERPPHY